MKAGKAAVAFAVSMTLFLNAAHASSAVTLASPNPQPGGNFGRSVVISGTTVVVGAATETEGVHTFAGHAYVFDASDGSLLATLTSPNAQTDGEFGGAVATSDSTVVVGAHGETAGGYVGRGQARVFDGPSGSFVFTFSSPNAQNDGEFGAAVATSDSTVVVGAHGETARGYGRAGHAYVFDAPSGSLLVTLTSPNAQTDGFFGGSVAISDTTVVVGASGETAGV